MINDLLKFFVLSVILSLAVNNGCLCQNKGYVRFGHPPDCTGSGICMISAHYFEGAVPVIFYNKTDNSHHNISVEMEIEMASLYEHQLEQFTSFASGTYTFMNEDGVEIPAKVLAAKYPVVIPNNYTIKIPSFSTCPITPPSKKPSYLKIALGKYNNADRILYHEGNGNIAREQSASRKHRQGQTRYAGRSRHNRHAKHTRYNGHTYSAHHKKHVRYLNKHEKKEIAAKKRKNEKEKEKKQLVKKEKQKEKESFAEKEKDEPIKDKDTARSDTSQTSLAMMAEIPAATPAEPAKPVKPDNPAPDAKGNQNRNTYLGLGAIILLIVLLIILGKKRRQEARQKKSAARSGGRAQQPQTAENSDTSAAAYVADEKTFSKSSDQNRRYSDTETGHKKYMPGYAAERTTDEIAELSEVVLAEDIHNDVNKAVNEETKITTYEEDITITDKQKIYFEGIRKTSDSLLDIIGDTPGRSNIQSGETESEHVDFSLSDIVYQVKSALQSRSEEKGLLLQVDIDREIDDIVAGDAVCLGQVLFQLADNAIRCTDKGSVTIKIKKTEEDTLRFSVIDTGNGIPQNILPAIFENFSTAYKPGNRKYEKTELNLHIFHNQVEIRDGKISIESKEGSGSIFSFIVKFKEGSKYRLDHWRATEEHTDGSMLDGINILIIDDDEHYRTVARKSLTAKARVEIEGVGTAHEAFDLLKKKKFDVILVDIQLPVMNGFDVSRYIREHFDIYVKNIPIIALTGSAQHYDDGKYKEAGINEYIEKSFRFSEYISAITRVLNIGLKKEKKHLNARPEHRSDEEIKSGHNVKFCEGCDAHNYLSALDKKVKMKKKPELIS